MNETPPAPGQQSQLRFALAILGIIALACVSAGTYLLATGYQSGELLIGIVGSIAGAIAGMLSMQRATATPHTASGAVATEIINPPSNPVPTQEATPA